MAKVRFRKPSMAAVMGEVITLAVWLFFGDRVVDVLDDLVGTDGEVNDSVFQDAYEILGLGTTDGASNNDNGLLGIVALVMVVMILMNFITYR